MNRLDGYTGDVRKRRQPHSMLPFLLTGAVVMFGFFVWATVQVSGL